jgi:hypothetical protein
VNGTQHKVGSVVMQDGAQMIATPSLEDRIAAIGVGNEFRDPLKRAISFYFWYHGKEGARGGDQRLTPRRVPDGYQALSRSPTTAVRHRLAWSRAADDARTLLTEKRLSALQRATLRQDLDRIEAVLDGIPATA